MEGETSTSSALRTPSPTPGPSGVTPTPGPSGVRSILVIEKRRGLSNEAALNALFDNDVLLDSLSEGGESEGEFMDSNISYVSKDNMPDPDMMDLAEEQAIDDPESIQSAIDDSESEIGNASDVSYEIPRRQTRTRRLSRRARNLRRQTHGVRRRTPVRSVGRDDGWRETEEFVPHAYIFDKDSAGMVPNAKLLPESRECEYFLNIMDTDVMDALVTETNRFHDQVNEAFGSLGASSRMKGWTEVTIPEMFVFLALTLLMPHSSKHRVRDYWSTDVFIQSPIFRRYMTRDRYYQISRFLHFTDNTCKEERRHD